MATLREIIVEGLRAFKALAPGDEPTVDELSMCLDLAQSIFRELHESRGPMTVVDVTDDYVAGENELVRVTDGYTVEVSTPNWVNIDTLKAADSYQDGLTRAPRDGSRVEIVGETQALFFYRADTNAWVSAAGLAVDDELPLNARYRSAFSSVLAFRLCKSWPVNINPPAWLERDAARGNSTLMHRTGAGRDPVQADYF